MVSDEELAHCALACWHNAKKVRDPSKFEEDARAVLQRLVDDRSLGIRVKHRYAIRALKRGLNVDTQNPANRKGNIPKALGLVSRTSKAAAIKPRAIVAMMHRLLEYSEFDRATNKLVFPYHSARQAADAVVIGFHDAGIDTALTPENVEQIWARRPQAAKTVTRR